MRMVPLLARCSRSCETSSDSGAGMVIASTRQACQHVASGISPSMFACSSREGVGLRPSPGKLIQALSRLLASHGVPESR
ncbi:MAG: hypothetical protein OXD30_02295, partial [Bryobacterales bacterium]|nr:hypothetical protein [Bryobacterales bacterium]